MAKNYELPCFVECFHSPCVLNLQETADIIDNVDILTTENKLQRLRRNELNFAYRSSPFQCMDDLAAIVGVTFRLSELRSGQNEAAGIFGNVSLSDLEQHQTGLVLLI